MGIGSKGQTSTPSFHRHLSPYLKTNRICQKCLEIYHGEKYNLMILFEILMQRHTPCLGLLHLASTVPHLLLSNLLPSEIEVDLILNIVSVSESYIDRIRNQLEIHPKNRVLKNQLRTYENYLTRLVPPSVPLREGDNSAACRIRAEFNSAS